MRGMISGHGGWAESGRIAGRVSRLLSVADGVGPGVRVLERAERSHRRGGGGVADPRRAGAGPHRPLPDRAQDRRRRHGHRLRRPRRAPQPDHRAQDPVGAGAGRDGPPAALAGGARRRQRQPSQRLPDLRDRRGRRPRLHRHGAARGRGAGGPPRPRRADGGGGPADRARRAGGAGRAARARHRPPRSEAVERLPDHARRQAARLRPGPARAGRRRRPRRRPDPDRHRDGHAALHVARAGGRRAGRSAERPVRGRHDPVRDAGRAAGVRRQVDRRGAARDPLRAAAGADRIAGGRGRRSRDPAGDGQAAGRSPGLGRRDGRRAARDPRHRERIDAGDGAGA